MGKRFAVLAVFAAGLLAGLAVRLIPVTAQGGGGAAPKGNGDVNADSLVDLSDPVYLLTFLYLGGPKPVDFECPPCPPQCPEKARIRLLNDLVCGQDQEEVQATLTVGGVVLPRPTYEPWGPCMEVDPAANIPVKIESSSCVPLCFSTTLTMVAGHIYSFVISVDAVGVFAIWFDQTGDCGTPGPLPTDRETGEIGECPGGGGLGGEGAFESRSGGWSRIAR